MNNWVVGTFYTIDSPYESVYYQYLLPSLKNLSKQYPHLRWIAKEAKNYKNWNANVAQKPLMISECLNELTSKDCLVFLDVDAVLKSYPIIFDEIPETSDIGFHTLNWRQWYGANTDTTELLTGTMFFRNNAKIKNLCQEWYEEAIKSQEWEQAVLQRIIGKHQLECYNLPIEYCYINSRPGGLPPLVKCDPVIVHHQVSRELKRGLQIER